MATTRQPWTLEDLLSRPRLAPYLAAAGGDRAAALELYNWNAQISAAFYESLHYVEIGLRNAMDNQLTAYAASIGATSPWYRDPLVRLTPSSRHKITKAITNATDNGQLPEIPGKVVAELMLGFWWSLLAEQYNRRLWQSCLRHAFDGPVRRGRLHRALDDLRKLRNRIAHHEPIHTRDLQQAYEQLTNTAGRISPRLRTRIESTTRIPTVLSQRPPAQAPTP